MAFEVESSAVKGENCWLELSLERNIHKTAKGLIVRAKADPRIEDFLKDLAAGEVEGVSLYGRYWHPVKPDGELKVYKIPKGSLQDMPGVHFNLPGAAFRHTNDGTLNLSFLRLVGIGSPEGVRFELSGPTSVSFARAIAPEITRQTVSFVREYISPMVINLRIVGQDLT